MKGTINSECNRTACKVSPAQYYNYSTKKYYCGTCASMINNFNRIDSEKLYGHDLCIKTEKLRWLVLEIYPNIKCKELDIMQEEEFSLFCHSIFRSGGIAMKIRNNFLLWNPDSENHKYFKQEFKISHPDEMSAVITKAIWRVHHYLM